MRRLDNSSVSSAYYLIDDAKDKMLKMIVEFHPDKAMQILMQINSADTYPNISKYQMAQVRTLFADLCYSHGYYGSAYEQYDRVLECKPDAPVKKKLKQLDDKLKNEEHEPVYLCDADIVDFDLIYSPPKRKPDEVIYDEALEREIEERLSRLDDLTVSEFRRLRHQHADGILSAYDLDLLTLEAMERSFNYNKDK